MSTTHTALTGYQDQSFAYKAYETLRMLFTDILPGTLTFVLPNFISWTYRTMYSGSIKYQELKTATKTASFFSHNVEKLNATTSAVLLLHGEHGHPYSMLHLADIADAEGRAVFSVHLPYDDTSPEHQVLLRQSIDAIEALFTQKGGRLSHLLLAGHSRGSIEAAHEAFVENNPKIHGVVAIAGRFKVIDPSLRPCRETLKPTVNAVWDKVRPNLPLRVPFKQIAATQEWCIDPEASLVREDQPHLSVNSSHLSVLNHFDTLRQFKEWVAV